MKTQLKSMLLFIAVSLIAFTGCKKSDLPVATSSEQGSVLGKAGGATQISAKTEGATQISGVAFLAATGECNSPLGQGAAFAIKMTGDLEGCLYAFIDDFECSPSGTYREEGRELFIGTYNGETGTFWTGYKFEGKYEGCAENGAPLGAEIFGRCQHPIVEGSGDGVFEGVTGRLDFKDDIEAGNFPFRGHLKF
ncbi:MAG: hypothetical protein H0V14_05095 [Chitinophagaceae bacterium]|nr:hypothetical protein [Chitinophagaceae bacterium]